MGTVSKQLLFANNDQLRRVIWVIEDGETSSEIIERMTVFSSAAACFDHLMAFHANCVLYPLTKGRLGYHALSYCIST